MDKKSIKNLKSSYILMEEKHLVFLEAKFLDTIKFNVKN